LNEVTRSNAGLNSEQCGGLDQFVREALNGLGGEQVFHAPVITHIPGDVRDQSLPGG
jgi:hypothetical protein